MRGTRRAVKKFAKKAIAEVKQGLHEFTSTFLIGRWQPGELRRVSVLDKRCPGCMPSSSYGLLAENGHLVKVAVRRKALTRIFERALTDTNVNSRHSIQAA
jgi:hypothetical protein